MTALSQYEKIEASGIWKPGPDERRLDVIVNIGESTLVISSNAGQPLGHWSLPAVHRLNPGETPALYAPAADGHETLEVEEELMVEAIEIVRGTIKRRRRGRGRGRIVSGLAAALAIICFCAAVSPNILRQYLLTVVPDFTRQELGSMLLEEVQRYGGRTCVGSGEQALLDQLHRHLLPEAEGRLHILSGRVGMSRHLTDGIIVLDRRLVENFDGPEALAGHVLLEATRAEAENPLDRLLRDTGVGGTFQLFTTGNIAPRRIAAHAKNLMITSPASVSEEKLLARFAAAGVSTTPYAKTISPGGETAAALIAADPVPRGGAQVLMRDADWVRLQGICADSG